MVSMPHSKVAFLMGLGLWGTTLRNLRTMGMITIRRQKRTVKIINKPNAKKKQITESPQKIVARFISAAEEYGQHLKSHTSAIISIHEAFQEMKRGTEIVNKALIYLTSSHN